MRCPGLQQGAIPGEVFVAEQRLDLRCPHQLVQKPAHDLLVQQPVAVLVPPARSAYGRGKGESGGMPDRIIRAQAHKPAEQEVVVELLQQATAPSGSRRTPAATRPAAAARAAPMAGLLRRRARRGWD